MSDRLRTSLIIPDTHRPFHSKRAYSLMLEVASFVGINEIVLLGDYADFYAVSAHSKDPRLPKMLHAEVESVIEGLDELDRAFPRAKKIYLEGNHENRLERYLSDKAPALFGLTACRDLFRLPQRPLWSYLDYGRDQSYRVLGTELHARHTPLASNAETGLRRALVSYTSGHTHRIVEAQVVGLDGRTRVAFSPGWLGDPRSSAFSYMHVPPQWQWGFALVSASGSSREFHHEIVQIKRDYSCVTHGKRFRG